MSLGAMLTGASLMLLAAFTPFVILRLIPIVEAAVVAQGISRSPARAAQTGMQGAYYASGLRRLAGGGTAVGRPIGAGAPASASRPGPGPGPVAGVGLGSGPLPGSPSSSAGGPASGLGLGAAPPGPTGPSGGARPAGSAGSPGPRGPAGSGRGGAGASAGAMPVGAVAGTAAAGGRAVRERTSSLADVGAESSPAGRHRAPAAARS